MSFREDEEMVRYVREQGRNPSEVAREAFEREVARMRRLAALDQLQDAPVPGAGDAAKDVRALRDDR